MYESMYPHLPSGVLKSSCPDEAATHTHTTTQPHKVNPSRLQGLYIHPPSSSWIYVHVSTQSLSHAPDAHGIVEPCPPPPQTPFAPTPLLLLS